MYHVMKRLLVHTLLLLYLCPMSCLSGAFANKLFRKIWTNEETGCLRNSRKDSILSPNSNFVGGDLEQKGMNLFDDAKHLPVTMSREKGNIEVRTSWQGNNMITIGEAKMVEHHSDEFISFLENFNAAFPKVNSMVRNVVSVKRENGREGVKSILHFPYPLKDRIMIHYKYLKLNRAQGDHLLIISDEENQGLLKKFLTSDDEKKYVLGRTFLCAYWVKPVYCSNNKKVIGSNVKYAFSGDTGGSIPLWIQNMIGPKTGLDSVRGLVEYIK